MLKEGKSCDVLSKYLHVRCTGTSIQDEPAEPEVFLTQLTP